MRLAHTDICLRPIANTSEHYTAKIMTLSCVTRHYTQERATRFDTEQQGITDNEEVEILRFYIYVNEREHDYSA